MLALTLMAHTEVLLSIQAEAHRDEKLVTSFVMEIDDRHEGSHNTKVISQLRFIFQCEMIFVQQCESN